MQMKKSEQAALSEHLGQEPVPTRRPTVPELEDRLFRPVPLLDHGFVRVVDYMGDDAAIVQAARVSYGRGTKTRSSDRGLIRYLLRNRHTTPFEMCELKIHVKLPIFVARQWIRHRTANVNEYSGRYSILDREFYVPEEKHLAQQSKSNRQGREELLTPEQAADVLTLLREDGNRAYRSYEMLLNDDGEGNPVREEDPMVARELARMGLSLNYYTQWYWKIDLHNLFHFLGLRAHSHAQYEIRVYAEAIANFVESWVPAAYGAFVDYRQEARTFSGPELAILRESLAPGFEESLAASPLSKREKTEMRAKLGLVE